MQILSHRGFWKTKEEQNSATAFRRSFENGFGVETDVRDFNKELFISHDVPDGSQMKLDEFFEIYNSYKSKPYLALNIKADGLQKKLFDAINKFDIKHYFVFDMSIPDLIGYLKQNFKCFTRQSEYEDLPLYRKSQGVWMDCFESDWIEKDDVIRHLNNKKKICIVSPELHKRDYDLAWHRYIKFGLKDDPNFMICTDFPDKFQLLLNKNV